MENEQELTREQELLTKDRQELIDEVLRLEKELKEANEDKRIYSEMYHNLSEKHNNYKNAVKGVTLLID
jgi:hypothetical protein